MRVCTWCNPEYWDPTPEHPDDIGLNEDWEKATGIRIRSYCRKCWDDQVAAMNANLHESDYWEWDYADLED